tara:strand:+ start:658 stop:1284 length:627 start_codon:yes stop_codon:yes gene_type:complete
LKELEIPKKIWRPKLIGASIVYYPNFWTDNECDYYFKNLMEVIPWRKDKIKVFGKLYDQPRLTSLHSDNINPYSYSGIKMFPNKMNKSLNEIKNKIYKVCNEKFSSVLINLYRDGNDSNGWHADDEKELGVNPTIASVSFGEERYFQMKHKNLKIEPIKFKLESGSLLIMSGTTQHEWYHKIPKTSKKISSRINLTFRKIYSQNLHNL